MNRKVEGTLIGVDGNAFSLMGHFKELARRQGFDKDWIDSVLKKAMLSDYSNLIITLAENMTMIKEA